MAPKTIVDSGTPPITQENTVRGLMNAVYAADELSKMPTEDEMTAKTEIETCEGCRYLEYRGLPRWACRKIRKHTPRNMNEGYPIRACKGEYRK